MSDPSRALHHPLAVVRRLAHHIRHLGLYLVPALLTFVLQNKPNQYTNDQSNAQERNTTNKVSHAGALSTILTTNKNIPKPTNKPVMTITIAQINPISILLQDLARFFWRVW